MITGPLSWKRSAAASAAAAAAVAVN